MEDAPEPLERNGKEALAELSELGGTLPALVTKEESDGLPAVPEGLTLTRVPGSPLLLLAFSSDPAHPADPLTWSYIYRYWMTLLAALLLLNTALASSAPSGAGPEFSAHFGGDSALILSVYILGYVAAPFICAPVSEAYGRRPVYLWGTLLYTAFTAGCIGAPNFGGLLALRFLCGTFGAVPMTNSAAVCGDIWTAKERGEAMSYYSVATFAGPALGPVIGSFVADRLGWRYVFIIMTGFSTLLCAVVVFDAPETYPAVIVSRLATELRESTGDDRIVSRLQFAEMATRGTPRWQRFKSETVRILGTPFIMLATEATAICATAFMSLVYGIVYLLFVAYPVIFSEIHQLGPGYASLPFLSILIGAIVSVPFTLWFQRKFLRDVANNGGVPTPEMRLPMAQAGGLLVVAALLWLGWGGYKKSIPWIVPALSGIPQGVALVFIFRAISTYIIDAYERNAASATAAAVVVRSIAGGVFPLFAESMFHHLGVQWGCTLLAGAMLLLVPFPFVFERYGPQIRKRSRYAQGR